MKRVIGLSCVFAFGACSMLRAVQPQDPSVMTNQMNAADVPQSAANTVSFKTPLKAFQTYYGHWTNGNAKLLFDCYTDSLKTNQLEGQTFPSDQTFTDIRTRITADGDVNFQLISFIFTSNSQRPKINAIITYTDNQPSARAESLDLTFVDTATGWKIDDLDGEDKTGQ